MPEYIERDEALEKITHLCEDEKVRGVFDLFVGVREILVCAPAADVEPVRHGRWIPMGGSNAKCSFCHTVRKTDLARDHYCPNCGAKMDLGGGEK